VLNVVYLIFNEGYAGNTMLSAEALWLGEALVALSPQESEVQALLALMLIKDSRRDARVVEGEVVLLDRQDRARWDHDELARGREALIRSQTTGERGPFLLQAAIASLHACAQPDYRQIAALYGELWVLTRSPVVELNLCVAVARVEGPSVGLERMAALELSGYRYFHSSRAELLYQVGRLDEARDEYERTLDLTSPGAERRRFETRLAEIEAALMN
jgi:RNA polymerase sigma-70 factor (ECF subfamily)